MIKTTERAYCDADAGAVRVKRDIDSDTVTIITGGTELRLYYDEIDPVIQMLQDFKREIDADKPAADGGL